MAAPVDIFSLSLPWAPPSAQVFTFDAFEALSQPYVVAVTMVLRAHELADLEPALDVRASLAVHDGQGEARAHLAGVVTAASLVRALSNEAFYRVELRPALWKLSLTTRSRVWVDKTLPEIVQEVLREHGVEHSLALRKRYPRMPHTCQYRESDLDFLSRWMEREGIYYFFEHRAEGELLHVVDDVSAHTKAPEQAVRYYAVSPDDTSTPEAMHAFRSLHGAVAQRVKHHDYNDQTPTLDLAAEEDVPGGKRGAVTVFGGNHVTQAESRRRALLRAEEHGARSKVFRGAGRVFGLSPGFRFELAEHPRGSLNAEYLVTSLEHRGQGSAAAADGAPVYRVEVTGIEAATPFRPALATAKPRIFGLQRARVDGPVSSEYAQIDEHGRYKVRLMFDEATRRDGQNSTWVRMLQPHGGEPEGFHFPLRKDTEVYVSYVEGDPDRPLIVGAVPNAVTPSTVTEPNHSQNVIMTGGRNRVEIEDQDGSQYIEVSSPPQNSSLHLGAHNGPLHHGHNLTLTTDGNGLIHTGGERNVTVDGAQNETVDGDLTEHYKSNQTTTVDGDFTETIQGAATQTINTGETRTVNSGVTETITGGETRDVTGGQTETITGATSRSIGAALTDTIGGSVTVAIDANQTETIMGPLSQTVTGGVTLNTQGALTQIGVGGLEFNAPAGFTVIAPGVTVIDAFWQAAGKSIERKYGFEKSFKLSKYEFVLGMAFGVFGAKAESVGLKFEAVGAAFEGKATKVKDVKAKLTGAGLKTWLKAFISLG